MPPSNQYLLDILLSFKSTGITGIASQVQSELAKIKAAGPTGDGSVKDRSRDLLLAAERQITEERKNAIAAAGTDRAKIDAAKKDAQAARRDVTLAGKAAGQSLSDDLKSKARSGLTENQFKALVGGQVLPTPSRFAAGGAGGGPRGPIKPNKPDPDDAHDAAQARADAVASHNAVNELLSGSKGYTKELVKEAKLRARMSAQLNEQLAASKKYLQETVRDANAKRRLSINENRALLNDPDYARNAGYDNTVKARLARAEQLAEAKARTPRDNNEDAQLRALNSKNERAVRIQELKNQQSDGTARELGEIRALTEKQKRAANAAYRRQTKNDIPAIAGDKFDTQIRESAVKNQLAKYRDTATPRGAALAQEEALTAAMEQRRAAHIRNVIAQDQAGNSRYLQDLASTSRAEKERADRIRAAELGVAGATNPGVDIEDVRARSAVAHRTREAERATAVAKATTDSDIRASVNKRIAENRLEGAIRAQERAYIQNALKQGQLNGTGFQRLQARFNPRGLAPEELPTLGQFVGQKTLTAGAYAIAGTALYGSVSAIKDIVREAEELDRVLNQVQAQFDSIGQGDQFAGFREEILAISKDTGVAADQVATVAFQFKGAFGDSAEAVKNLRAAMEITQVTGLSLEEVVDSLTATSKTYGISIEDIGDKATGLEERFGVLSKQTITFTADLATTAQQAGLSFDKIAALGAVAQQVSGKSGASLAESFGRILPSIQDSSSEILKLYDTINKQGLKGQVASTDTISEALGAGKTGVVFEQIVRDYDKLNQSQKNYIITLLGSRREAQSLIPVLQNSQKLIAEWDRTGSDNGKLKQRFEDLRETVQNTFQRANELFKQFGTALFELGLADIFVKAGNAASIFLTVLTKIAALVGFIFDIPLLGDYLGQLLQIGIIAVGVSKAYTLMAAALGALHIGQKAATAATIEESQANALQSVTATEATASLTGQAAAARGLAGANYTAGTSSAFAGTNSAGGLVSGLYGAPTQPSALSRAGASLFPAGRFGGTGGVAGLFTAGGADAISGGAAAAIGGAGVLAVLSKYMDERAKLEKTASEFLTQLQTTDDKKLKAFVDASDGQANGFDNETLFQVGALLGPAAAVIAKIGGTQILGQTDPELLAIQEYNKRQADRGTKLFDALDKRDKEKGTSLTTEFLKSVNETNRNSVLSHFGEGSASYDTDIRELLEESFAGDQAAFKELRKRATEGNVHAQEAIDFLGRVADHSVSTTKDVKQAVDEMLKSNDRSTAASAVGGQDILSQLNVDTVSKLQKNSEVTTQQVLDVIDSELALQQKLYSDAKNAGNTQEAQKALDEILKLKDQRTQTNDAIREKRNEYRRLTRELEGTSNPNRELGDLIGQTKDPTLTTEQRLGLTGKLVDGLKAKFEADIKRTGDHFNSAREQLAIAERGIQVPSEIQEGLVTSSIQGDAQQNQAVKKVADAIGVSYDSLLKDVSGRVTKDRITVLQALRLALEAQITEVERLILQSAPNADRAPLYEKLEGLKKSMGEVETELAKNPGGPAPDQLKTEEEKLLEMRIAAAEETVAEAEAEANLYKAQNSNNPFAQAAADMKVAQTQLALAFLKKDPIGMINAQTAIASAQRAAVEASRDVTRATLEGASSIARNPVASTNAEIAVQRFELAAQRADGNIAGAIRAQNSLNQLAIQQQENIADITRAGLEAAGNTGDPVRDTNAQIAVQRFELAQAQQKGDIAAQIRAFTELGRLNQSQADNMSAIADSADDLRIARIRDPFKAIIEKIGKAERKVRDAKGEAERNAAQQELEQLRRDLAESFDAIISAQVDVAVAMADKRGDSVGSAKIRLQEARRLLDKAVSEGAGGEEIARLKAEVIRSEASAADALFSSRMDDIDFMLEFGKITARQAIAMLEALLATPDIRENQEKVRSIQRKIKSLQGDLGRDLQFNLPTALGLPTLYEARRVNQSSRAGIGYQDNRNINLQITVANPGDLERVRGMIDDSVSAPTSRFAPGGRKY